MSQSGSDKENSPRQQLVNEPVGALIARVLGMLTDGMSPQMALARLASAGEAVAGPGTTVSILVLDKDGLLRNGASPNLPADYLDAIDRLRPDPTLGTCASAAATGEAVMTPDFLADDKWSELRHLPLALGYAGAWSQPIKASDGTVLGTFGTYFRERRHPTPEERSAVEILAAGAAAIISTSGLWTQIGS